MMSMTFPPSKFEKVVHDILMHDTQINIHTGMADLVIVTGPLSFW